jgi:hypothetical protein
MVFKKIIYVFSLIIFIIFFSKSWHSFTGGFKTDKIQPPLTMKSDLTELPLLSKEELSKILDQEYKFLDKGCQVYVFESEDGNYVIKFIRHHRYRPYFWMNIGSFIPWIKEYRDKYEFLKKERIKNNVISYKLSYEELQDLTKVVYLHLGKTNHLNKKLAVKDRFGIKSYLDLDNMHFLIQKKGKKFTTELLNSYNKKEYDKVKNFIDGYLTLLQTRCLKKIRNCDSTGFIRNMAVYEDEVIEIDVGGYKKFNYSDAKKGFQYEFMRFVKRFIRWSAKKMPPYEKYIDQKSHEILEKTLLSIS